MNPRRLLKKHNTAILLALIFLLFITPSALSADFQLIYVVQRGDSLSEIASSYNISLDKLIKINNISNFHSIRAGDELKIPANEAEIPDRDFNQRLFNRRENFILDSSQNYAVRINPDQETPEIDDISDAELISYHVSYGDTLYDIARDFNTSIGVLEALNDFNNGVLRAGQAITVPVRNLSQRQALSRSISSEELDLLARAIYGESRGEPYTGQVAVGAVIINRVLSPDFPGSIEGVIYQSGQFSPVEDGSLYLEPDNNARSAARDALSGEDPSGGALFFYNPDKATDREWVTRRQKLVTIGNHVFLK